VAADIKQEPRLLSIKTPLGADVLILQSFAGTERISSLFSYQLELLSAQDNIPPADIVGKNVTITLDLADGSQRFFNGFVSQFVGGAMFTRELRRYRAEVVPWLWFLTRASDCRIFQFNTVPQIIEQVLPDLGFTDFEMDLQGNHPEREYCVQYRETAFNFVSRLMEEEGMFYWFRHEDGKHTLVVADHKGAYVDCPENAIDYVPGSLTEDHIGAWEHHYEYRSGKYAQSDYNFETPSTSLLTNTNTLIDLPDIGNYELYDYPGEYRIKSDGEDLTKIRMEEQEVPYDTVRCDSGCRTLHTLGKFTVTRHECSAEENKSYLITAIEHSATDQTQLVGGGETFYQNRFTCIPDSVIFRPARVTPKSKVRGPQTAVVVGPAGEEIYTDKYGRVKVQFYWDRYSRSNENSSCWIRVAHLWAGKNWGAIATPRIGQEVIVDFLEGDPDQPIITGRVYNAEQMPPYDLPASKTQTGIKTRSSQKGSPANFNEIRFEDKKGQEQIYIHAEKNLSTVVEASESRSVGGSRSTTIQKDETLVIKEGDRTETLEQGDDTLQLDKGDRKVTLSLGDDTLEASAGNITRTAPAGEIKHNALNIKIDGTTSVNLTCGASSIEMTPASITINSPIVKIN